jgi:serine/threonine-protein kinase
MLKRAVLAVNAAIAVTAAILPTLAQAEQWRPYINGRFGAAADVPADWVGGEQPDNGDGLQFLSPNGEATLTVWGSFNLFDFARMMAPSKGQVVTYSVRGSNWFVVSGLSGDRIFYRKQILGCRGGGLDRRVYRIPGGSECRL